MKTFNVENRRGGNAQIERYIQLFSRIIAKRTGVTVTLVGASPAHVTFDLDGAIPLNAYSIHGESGGPLHVTGGDELGLLYGIGKLLHDGKFADGRFEPGPWRGTSIPQGEVRGMYFAFHNNWYANAPVQDVLHYIDDLALWGMNALLFHLPKYEPKVDDDGNLIERRSHTLLRYAHSLGLKIGLLSELNIPHDEAPPEILAQEYPDTDPPRRGFHPTFVCPSVPEGFDYLSKQLADYLEDWTDIGLDYVVAFPYDAGGCGCAQCWPWGARGYLKVAKEFSRHTREKHPRAKFVLGTWCYDVREESDGEYDGLEAELAQDKSWVDIIMADGHEDFPAHPLQPGALAGLPIINFAEISMWGRFPWGGSGANPYTARLQKLWDQASSVLTGGFPYSEGNFEDINKIVTLRFFWDRDATAADSVEQYVLYEFGAEAVQDVTEAIGLMERTLTEWDRDVEDVKRAYHLILGVHDTLPERIRTSWRWQILYWRAIVDFERATHDSAITRRCDSAYESLIEVLHLQNGWRAVTPPAHSYISRIAPAALQTVIPGSTPELDAVSA